MTRLDINLYIDNYKKEKQMKYIHTLSRIKVKKNQKKVIMNSTKKTSR